MRFALECTVCVLVIPMAVLVGCSAKSYPGGINPLCDADPTQESGGVIDDCGVFVSASAAPGGDGTKARPFQSFGEATAMMPKRVYACAEAYAETEGVRFSGGVEIYGGFRECGGAWTWSATEKATLKGPAGDVALTLSDGDNRVVNLDVVAANATTPGGSSIAVVAIGGTMAWTSGDLSAGDAKDGAPGLTHPPDEMLDGEDGDPGVDLCDGGVENAGPASARKTCKTGGISVGGNGGDGGISASSNSLPGGNGGDGAPADPTDLTMGTGGIGEGQGDPPAQSCVNGEDGASGADGSSGPGATGIGVMNARGYVGVDGTAGTDGKPGQGGGGGGGAKGGAINCDGNTMYRAGASGGAGGTGSCGGHGGGGGRAGGSSIALVVVDAAVRLEGVKLTPARGGTGGPGGDGQAGGTKGRGGSFGAGDGDANDSCRGGDGGSGGNGAPGGGGRGGHSLGIAFQGSTPPMGGGAVIDPANVGSGGPGGDGNTTPQGGAGLDGIADSCWDFSANSSCAK